MCHMEERMALTRYVLEYFQIDGYILFIRTKSSINSQACWLN